MMTPGESASVTESLAEVAGKRRGYRVAAAWVWAVVVWLGVGLAIIVVDGVFGIPGVAAVIVSVAWMMVLPWMLWQRWPRRTNPTHETLGDARHLEVEYRLPDSPLTNAVAIPEAGDDPYAAALSRRTRSRGREVLAGLDTSPLLESDRPRRAAAYLWLIVVIALVTVVIQPRLFLAGLPRLTLPWAGAAPFSMTDIDVTWSPDPLYVDQPLDIEASTSGVIPEDATLVELDSAGEEVRRLPMNPSEGGTFGFALEGLTEPVTYRVEAGTGQSEPFTIEPLSRPEGAAASGAESEHDGREAGESPASPRARAASLAAEAATLRKEVDSAGPGDTTPEQAQAQRDAAVRLAEALRELISELEPSEQARCNALANALDAFAKGRSPGIGRSPSPTGSGDTDAETGFTSLDGPGQPSLSLPNAAGAYDDRGMTAADGDTPDAIANRAPAAYRDLVRLYIERLAEDESRKDP